MQRRILSYLDNHMAQAEHPHDFGEALRSNFARLRGYCVDGDRVVCRMADDRLVVLVIRIGRRRDGFGRWHGGRLAEL